MLEFIFNRIWLNSIGLLLILPSVFYLGIAIGKKGSLKKFLDTIIED